MVWAKHFPGPNRGFGISCNVIPRIQPTHLQFLYRVHTRIVSPFISIMIRARMLPPLRSAAKPGIMPARCFSTSPALKEAGSALPARKPVGAFRGGVLGFLTGSAAAGAAVYWYILSEYRTANEMLSEDIYALQLATQQLQTYIMELETKVDSVQKKK